MNGLTQEELSKKGGLATKQKYGADHYKMMGKKSAESRKKKNPDAFKDFAKIGLEARKKKAAEQKPGVVQRLSKALFGG